MLRVNYCEQKKQKCDKSPYQTKVGKQEYEFCCEKAFIESVKEFNEKRLKIIN